VHVLPIPGHLPVQRRALRVGARLAVAAITIDFGNTLVRTDRASFATVVDETADALSNRGLVTDRAAFLAAWAEERDRQFREEVPQLREVDVNQRAVRVLARLRGMSAPPPHERWDDLAAAARVEPAEIDVVVDAYSAAFIERMQPVDDATATLARLAADGFALAILSNWPLAVTIDRYAQVQGWLPFLRAIVVSQRVGTIKPHPSIFRAAEDQLGFRQQAGAARQPGTIAPILHDWAADVVGGARAGWRTAYLRDRQGDTPLPTSEPGDGLAVHERVEADLVIDELRDLPALVELDRTAVAVTSATDSPRPTDARTSA
jgi:FMN phosphatase YigB (HAD superfamily)